MSNTNEQKPTITTVEATLDDIERAAMLFDAYRQFYKQPSAIEGARAFLTARLQEKSSVVFLAHINDVAFPQAVGFMQLYPLFSPLSLKPLWLLSDLFVVPEARDGGIGKALLQRARLLAVQTQADGLTLQTAKDNYVAQALYEDQGWELENTFLTYNLFL